MGILKKVKGAVSSKANAALDRAIDPEKELDLVIMDLDSQHRRALQELLSYKASAKQMERSVEEQSAQALAWEKRAMIAVKKGDDGLAKDCLQRKKQCEIELVKIKRDQAEAASYAAGMNKSRKVLETKLKMLKLRKGSLATQLAAARSGKGDVFAQSDELFEKMDEAERLIDAELFEQEAELELSGQAASDQALESQLLKAASMPSLVETNDDPLHALKAKMAGEKKQLKE